MSERLRLSVESELLPEIRALFFKRYRQEAPDFPEHACFWHEASEGARPRLACYIHFTACGELLLGGGACVDPAVIRAMSPEMRDHVRAAGGLYAMALRASLEHFDARFKAVFGYCGDPLAERVDRAAGFVDTGHPHLLVYWLSDCDAATQSELIAQAHAVGPF